MLQALKDLREKWDGGEWLPEDGDWFPTPGLRIAAEKTAEKTRDETVCSKHAGEIAAMVRSVRGALLDDLDFFDQEDLYRRMGAAANAAIRKNGTRREILEAVLSEAEEVYDEWNRYLFFAFDELMDPGRMRAVCPSAKQYGTAKVDGYDILLDKEGCLTAVPDWEKSVEGVLWMVKQQEMPLIEEYKNGPSDRFKKRSLVMSAGGELLSAQTYLSRDGAAESSVPAPVLPEICNYARENGLSEEYCHRLEQLQKR